MSAEQIETPDARHYPTESAAIANLKPHPRNYRVHEDDQLDHLIQSISEHGFYRNVVVTTDGTILAGHGVVLAAAKAGMTEVPVVRLDIDPNGPKALKILTGDNELSHLTHVDDRALTDLLKEIREVDIEGLLGTGYDDQMLANLVYMTRTSDEIETLDAAAHWVGLPDFDGGEIPLRAIVQFDSEEDRLLFLEKVGVRVDNAYKKLKTWSMWWPDRERESPSSLRFIVDREDEPPAGNDP